MADSEAPVSDKSGIRTRVTFSQSGGSSTSTKTGNLVLQTSLVRANQSRGKVPGYDLWKGNGFGLSKSRITGLSGSFTYFNPVPWTKWTDSGKLSLQYGTPTANALGNWTSLESDSFLNRAEMDMLTGFKRGPNLALMLAERKQIESLAVGFVETTSAVIRDIRKRDFKRAYQRLTGRVRKAADLQLVMQYGVRPLASDVFDSITVITQEPRPPLVTVNGKSRDNREYVESDFGGYNGIKRTRRFTRNSGWETSLVALCTDEALAIAESAGLTNPALILWETLPYSFCLDWILPVGPAIEANTATTGFTFLTGSKTRRLECILSETHTGVGQMTGSCTGSAYSKEISRSAYNDFPLVIPVVDVRFSPTRLANAVAMGWQQWDRKIR